MNMVMRLLSALMVLVPTGIIACQSTNTNIGTNYNCGWKLSRCANLLPVNDCGPFLRLDARFSAWQQDKFCQAFKTDLIKHGDYTMSVEIWNEQSSSGQNYGHLGLMFNVWDEYNYDFVYLRIHWPDGRIQPGTVTDGKMSLAANIADQTPISGPTWNTLKVVVTQVSKNAAVYLNSKRLGTFNFTSTARGYGGVIIANGYENIGMFRSFSIL